MSLFVFKCSFFYWFCGWQLWYDTSLDVKKLENMIHWNVYSVNASENTYNWSAEKNTVTFMIITVHLIFHRRLDRCFWWINNNVYHLTYNSVLQGVGILIMILKIKQFQNGFPLPPWRYDIYVRMHTWNHHYSSLKLGTGLLWFLDDS